MEQKIDEISEINLMERDRKGCESEIFRELR